MRLHRVLFFLLLILLPVQLGRHFWPDFSLVFGLRVDYLSPTIYLTDLLVMGILGSWLFEMRKKRDKIHKQLKGYWWLGAVFAFLLLNAFFAPNQGAAFYKLIRIIEFSLLGLYVAKTKPRLPLVANLLSISVIYSSFIAIAQFLKQASLDGVFWWLGERTFNDFTPGIARAVWDGRLIMRPYATFSHPNVLAGFVLVSLILIVIGKTQEAKRRIIRRLAVIIGAIAITISFSRSVWIVGILVCFWLVIRYLRKNKLNQKFFYFALCALLFVLGAFFYSTLHFSTEEAISRRLQLNNAAIEMIQENPLVGVGLNNFIFRLPDYWQTSEAVRFLQPVHNIFLLVAAETGLIGLILFLWFLALTFKRLLNVPKLFIIHYSLVIALGAILLLGVADHYWLTLQQTQLLFTLILGMSWAKH